jgi:hypothetical protein
MIHTLWTTLQINPLPVDELALYTISAYAHFQTFNLSTVLHRLLCKTEKRVFCSQLATPHASSYWTAQRNITDDAIEIGIQKSIPSYADEKCRTGIYK